ncbi:hypothetical protein PSTT_16672, partial [Puccinia striiformis]
MGIQGLLPFLRSIQRESHLKHWAGKTLAIDGYVWLHRGAYHCAQELCLGSPTKKHVEYFVQKIKLLHAFGVTAYVVFDGDHLPSKKITEDDRENRRRTALTNANRLLAQGDQKKAREEFVKAVDVTPQLAYDVILALRSMGVKYVVAPYEADAQLRFLEMKGEIRICYESFIIHFQEFWTDVLSTRVFQFAYGIVSSTPSRPTTTTISHDSTCSKGLESINATSSKFFDCQTSKQPDISCAEFDSESQGFVATQTTVEDLRAEDATPLTQEGWDAISEMSIEGPVDAKLEDVRRDMEFDKLIGDDLPSSQMHDPFNVSVTLPTISRPEPHPYSSLSPISSSYSASNKENREPSFKEDYSIHLSVLHHRKKSRISRAKYLRCSDLDEARVTIITPNNHNSMSTAANCRRASEPISRQTRQLPISSDPILSSDEDNDENDRTKVLDSGLNNRRKGAKSTSHSHQPFKRVCRGFVETPSSKLSKLAKRSEISPSLARVASGIRNRFTYQKPSSSSSEKRLPIGKPKLFDFSRKSSSSNSNSNSNNEVEKKNQNNSKTSSSEKRLSTTSTTSHRKSCQLPLGTSSSTILNDLSDDHTKKNESDLQPYLSLKCQTNSKKSTSKKQSLCNTSSIKSVPPHPAPLTSTRTTSNKLSMFIFRGNVN